MMEEMNKKETEQVAGGSGDSWHDLGNYTWGTVHDVVDYGPGTDSKLTLRDNPNGNIISGYGWQNNDSIRVNPITRDGNWIMAYCGIYGWVNANYVWY